MHTVNYLFEDIRRSDWDIASIAKTERRRGKIGPWKRDLRFLVGRKQG